MLINQAILLNKRGSLANIIDWPTYKARLIKEFGSINIFEWDLEGVFKHLSCYKSVQEVAKDLAPKIKTLQASLEVVNQFHNRDNLYNITLTPNLNQYIIKCFPMEVRSYFNKKYEFVDIDSDSFRALVTFQFIAQFVCKLERNYRANPSLFDLDFSPLNVGIKPVQFGTPGGQHQTSHRPLPKTNSAEISKIISSSKLCPSCKYMHDTSYQCNLIFHDGASKVCTKGCKLHGIPCQSSCLQTQ